MSSPPDPRLHARGAQQVPECGLQSWNVSRPGHSGQVTADQLVRPGVEVAPWAGGGAAAIDLQRQSQHMRGVGEHRARRRDIDLMNAVHAAVAVPQLGRERALRDSQPCGAISSNWYLSTGPYRPPRGIRRERRSRLHLVDVGHRPGQFDDHPQAERRPASRVRVSREASGDVPVPLPVFSEACAVGRTLIEHTRVSPTPVTRALSDSSIFSMTSEGRGRSRISCCLCQ